MKSLSLLPILLSCLLGCQKPPKPAAVYPSDDGYSNPLKNAPICPSENPGSIEGSICTDAEFVAYEDGRIIAYYQSGMWKKPNGEPFESRVTLEHSPTTKPLLREGNKMGKVKP